MAWKIFNRKHSISASRLFSEQVNMVLGIIIWNVFFCWNAMISIWCGSTKALPATFHITWSWIIYSYHKFTWYLESSSRHIHMHCIQTPLHTTLSQWRFKFVISRVYAMRVVRIYFYDLHIKIVVRISTIQKKKKREQWITSLRLIKNHIIINNSLFLHTDADSCW